jgi:hypothetical protein
MRRILSCVNAIALAVVVGLSACVDQQAPFGPEVGGSDVSLPFFSQQPADGFTVLRRTKPLSRRVTVTQTVGASGGTIKLRGAGVTLEISAGALSANTAITITAPSGNVVAFEFSPHGLRFGAAASIRLDIKGTTAEGAKDSDAYAGVYFVGDMSAAVQPLELLRTHLDGRQIVFDIEHFSGYAVAGGRSKGKGTAKGNNKKPKKGR